MFKVRQAIDAYVIRKEGGNPRDTTEGCGLR